jgi:hypothetical protein
MTRYVYLGTRTRAIYSSQQAATKAESLTNKSPSDWYCCLSQSADYILQQSTPAIGIAVRPYVSEIQYGLEPKEPYL